MKLKITIPAAMAALLICGTLTAESLPLKSVNKANEVIDSAIEAHGGTATLESEVNVGTVMTLILPLERLRVETKTSRQAAA